MSTHDPDVLAIIEQVVTVLAPRFRFGYFDYDDIAQEARLIRLCQLG
jgi:hypothetical protein